MYLHSARLTEECIDCQAPLGPFIYLKLNVHQCHTGDTAFKILETVTKLERSNFV